MSFDQMPRTPHSLTMSKKGAGTSGTAYTQAVQDFLHPQYVYASIYIYVHIHVYICVKAYSIFVLYWPQPSW